MASLLHKDVRTVLASCLESLAQDGVQRFFKELFFVEEGDVMCHQQLHTFDGVIC